jgi:hypothetical protein
MQQSVQFQVYVYSCAALQTLQSTKQEHLRESFNEHKIISNIFRMQDLQARLISAGFSEVAFRIINSKLAINETEGFSMLKNLAGDIPVLQEPYSIVSSSWQSILEAGIDHILVLDR